MVQITNEMKSLREKRIAKFEERIDNCIKSAVKDGRTECYFPCDKDYDKDVYDEVRAKYEKAGYIIKPTGYIGGVWQLTVPIMQSYVSGRGTDMGEDFEDWDMYSLRERVKLVQEFDELCDKCLEAFVWLIDNAEIEEEEYEVTETRTRRVLCY